MPPDAQPPFASIEEVEDRFAQHQYIADRRLATIVYLATALGRPLLLEGEPGVGKTEVAKVLAACIGTELVRLQCYEGLDTHTALYEWNYPRQMLELRLQEARGADRERIGVNLFSEDFLLRRPLLQALEDADGKPRVLLIDEIDRSDEAFEAFLLEVLSDFQVSIPELGTIKSVRPPIVVLTSNRSRELHDALKRRCLYHWVDYPDLEQELRILAVRLPGIEQHLAAQACRFAQWLRTQDLLKRPGIAELIDWAEVLVVLGADDLGEDLVSETLGCILKYQRDLQAIQGRDIREVLAQIQRLASDPADGGRLGVASGANIR